MKTEKITYFHITACALKFFHLPFARNVALFIIGMGMMAVPFKVACAEDAMVSQKAGFYYTVQKGDTLWDLSHRFSDSPWLWPDLWRENDQIANPHWIYPGNKIRIYRKDWVSKFKTPVEMAPLENPAAPVIYYYCRDINMVGFIRKDPVPPSAVIFKSRDDKELISEGDVVFLTKAAENTFFPGSLYTVYRTFDPLEDKSTKKEVGVQHYITGVVEILKEEPAFATGKVIQSFRYIRAKDKLMPYVRKSEEIPIISNTRKLYGAVIIGEENQVITGDHDIAFINLGEDDGVHPGNFFQAFEQEEVNMGRGSNGNVLLDPQIFGEMLVLHTEANTSTVLITKAQKPISSGTKVHSLME